MKHSFFIRSGRSWLEAVLLSPLLLLQVLPVEGQVMKIKVADNGVGSALLTFGWGADATPGIDAELGEVELPPLPPKGAFDARFLVSSMVGSNMDLRPVGDPEETWDIRFQPSVSGYPVTLIWDPASLFPDGKIRLLVAGSDEVDMRTQASLSVTDETINTVSVIYTANLSGDFDGSGRVYFDDFFLFADAFGGNNPQYDLDNSGTVDFDDFVIFADNFGKEERAKLMVLAQQYLGLPAMASLETNYPNPFNISTTIRYLLAESGQVHLRIYDLTGQKIRTLVNENQIPGSFAVTWDGTNEQGQIVSTGIYLTKLQTGTFTDVRKMLLIK